VQSINEDGSCLYMDLSDVASSARADHAIITFSQFKLKLSSLPNPDTFPVAHPYRGPRSYDS
jgi:hypothetical protein